MRQGEILQRTATQQAAPELVPDLENVVGVKAAVDQGPSRPVVEQPAIDVMGSVGIGSRTQNSLAAGPSVRHRPAGAGR